MILRPLLWSYRKHVWFGWLRLRVYNGNAAGDLKRCALNIHIQTTNKYTHTRAYNYPYKVWTMELIFGKRFNNSKKVKQPNKWTNKNKRLNFKPKWPVVMCAAGWLASLICVSFHGAVQLSHWLRTADWISSYVFICCEDQSYKLCWCCWWFGGWLGLDSPWWWH